MNADIYTSPVSYSCTTGPAFPADVAAYVAEALTVRAEPVKPVRRPWIRTRQVFLDQADDHGGTYYLGCAQTKRAARAMRRRICAEQGISSRRIKFSTLKEV